MDGDDADGRAGRVGDDDGLRLVAGEGRGIVEYRGHRPAATKKVSLSAHACNCRAF